MSPIQEQDQEPPGYRSTGAMRRSKGVAQVPPTHTTRMHGKDLRHGTVGHGNKVHAIYSGGDPLCGAGRSTLAHSFRNPRVRYVDEPLTCTRCQAIADANGPGQEYIVTVTRADNPGANFTQAMSATKIAATWPEFGSLLGRAVGLVHVTATFEDLCQIDIEAQE